MPAKPAQPALQTEEVALFASPSPTKIRVVTWVFLALLPACLGGASFIVTHLTAREGDPELASLAMRGTLALCVVGMSLVPFLGMWWYQGSYATRIDLLPPGDRLRVETLRLFGLRQRTLSVAQVRSASYHRGHLAYPGRPSVDAPWFWVDVEGSRSFLIDVQGEFCDSAALGRVLRAGHSRAIGGDATALLDGPE